MRVILESPFAGNIQRNRLYARLAMNIAILEHDEAPLAFHTVYTQCLNDKDPAHRKLGIERSFPWYEVAEKIIYMVDRGISVGMKDGFIAAKKLGKEVEFRTLSTNPALIKEVASWNCMTVAEEKITALRDLAIKDDAHYFLIHQDITPYALERRLAIKLIENVNDNGFTSPARQAQDSIYTP